MDHSAQGGRGEEYVDETVWGELESEEEEEEEEEEEVSAEATPALVTGSLNWPAVCLSCARRSQRRREKRQRTYRQEP